jgi:hypothetical protein
VETILVALLDENIDVWRPVQAKREGELIYRIVDKPSPAGEVWEFPPGSVVRCAWRELDGATSLVAVAAI